MNVKILPLHFSRSTSPSVYQCMLMCVASMLPFRQDPALPCPSHSMPLPCMQQCPSYPMPLSCPSHSMPLPCMQQCPSYPMPLSCNAMPLPCMHAVPLLSIPWPSDTLPHYSHIMPLPCHAQSLPQCLPSGIPPALIEV